MEKNSNQKNIEKQIKEIKETLWKMEKQMGFPSDELFIYKLIKDLEARINVIEEVLKIDEND